MIETSQVQLAIVSPDKEFYVPETGQSLHGKDVIKQMTINRVWHNDKQGRFAMVQYAGQCFKFREGEAKTVPESIGSRLRANSAICVGTDKLNGPIVPFLEIVKRTEMSESVSTKTPTTCPICGEDQLSFPKLTRHLAQERKKHPELFQEEKTEWEADEKPSKGTATDGDVD